MSFKDKTSSWHLNGFPMVVALGQQYNVGEKPIVILFLYTYISRHAGTPDQEAKIVVSHIRRVGCQPEKPSCT